MRQYVNDYVNFINDLKSGFNKKEEELKLDERKDESILYKVRVNICDIFHKMVNASDKKVATMKLNTEEEQIAAFNTDYLNWFEKIPVSWKTNMELASKHNDILVVKTEEIKLETANILRNKFLELIDNKDKSPTTNTGSASLIGGLNLYVGIRTSSESQSDLDSELKEDSQ